MGDFFAVGRFCDLKIEEVENVFAAGDRPARKAARRDLRQGGQIGPDAVLRLSPSRRNAETGDDLIEDQDHTVLTGQFAQAGQEVRVDRQLCAVRAGRLDDRGGDVAVRLEQAGEAFGIVLLGQQQAAAHTRQYTRRRAAVEVARVARGHVVVPAVEVVLEADQLRL